MRRLLTVLGMAATTVMGEQVGGGLQKTNVQKAGEWELARYSTDASGKQVVYCTAVVITGQEQALRMQLSKDQIVWGFMGDASGAVGKSPTVTYWFDNNTAGKKTVKMKELTTPEEGVEWLTYAQTNGEPGDEASYRNAVKVTFTYLHEGKKVTQPFSLKGGNAALKRLFEMCPR